MPLQIQTDASLASYVRRNLHLNWPASNMGIFERLATRHVLKTIELKGIAEALGWPGCYGFNRLLQGHTMMAATHVFKGSWDHSYSGRQYVSERERFSEWEAAFCPECVREDLELLGFSYWRRYGAPYVTVCYKHNVVGGGLPSTNTATIISSTPPATSCQAVVQRIDVPSSQRLPSTAPISHYQNLQPGSYASRVRYPPEQDRRWTSGVGSAAGSAKRGFAYSSGDSLAQL